MRAAIDWFVPRRVREGEPDLARRARLVIRFAWSLIVAGLIYAVVFAWLGSMISVAALLVAVAVAVLAMYVLRWTGSSVVAVNVLTFAFFGVLTVLTCNLGGHASAPLPWYAAVPLVALSAASRRSAVAWLTITALSLVVFYLIDHAGYTFRNDLAPPQYALLCLVAWIGLIVVVWVFARLYESLKDQMLSRLRQSEERFRALTENTSDVTVIINKAGVYTYASPSVMAIYGYAPEEVVGKGPRDFIHPDDLPAVEDALMRSSRIPGESVQLSSFRTRGKDGSWLFLEGLANCQFDQPGVNGIVFNGRDVTERAQREAQSAETLAKLTRFNRLAVGREQQMIELKREVNGLLQALGRGKKYAASDEQHADDEAVKSTALRQAEDSHEG